MAGAATDRAKLRPEVTEELLDDIVRRIVERFHPEEIILFGSYAWGEPREKSDLDLFVIMESDDTLFQRMGQVAAVAFTPHLPMDVIVRTPAEVRERLAMGDYFVEEILDKGVVLYDATGRVDRQGRGRLRIRGRSEPAPA